MISSSLLLWLSNDEGLLLMLAQNWLLGCLLIALIIFLETGVVIFPFLPGDTLLFTTGTFLAMAGVSPWLPVVIITAAAIAGDSCNYAIGQSRLGQQIIQRGWLKPEHLAKTQRYFARFGGLTITIGRFVPVVRTIAPFMAGLSGMSARRFLLFNVLGACIWCAGLLLAGYWLGQIPWIKEHFSALLVAAFALFWLFLLGRLGYAYWRRSHI